MEAIILAGGFGTRLRPFTFTRAKSLLPILNEPMISHLIKILPQKVDTVILAVNYRREQIENYFHHHDFGKTIIVNEEPEPLGTGGAVKFADKYINGSFFVLNADIICSLNLTEMNRYHEKKKAVATISLWPVENVSEFGVVDILKNGTITKFVEKPKAEDAPSDLINAGAYLLEPQVLNYIESGKLISMEKQIFPQIIQKTGHFFGYKFQGHWIDVGRINSYINVNIFLLEKHKKTFIVGEQCTIQGILRHSCIGNKVEIGKETIGDDSILKNVAIGDNEKIERNTIQNNVIIWNQSIPQGYPDKQIGNVIGE